MDEKTSALERLAGIVEKLRGPDGCPWDRAQRLEDMPRYLTEEVAEVVDAIEDADGRPSAEVRDELGDLLMNIFLAARIAEEAGAFSLADVAVEISEKLVRRHPHVFGEARARDVEEVLEHWNAIKAAEAAARSVGGDGPGDGGSEASPRVSRLDRVPRTLPPLARAFELGKEAARVGFDFEDAHGAFAKVREEMGEVERALGPGATPPGEDEGARAAIEEELGDLLFAVANLCRKLDVRPEVALRRTLRKFYDRFRYLEERHADPAGASLEELEATWQQAKESRNRT